MYQLGDRVFINNVNDNSDYYDYINDILVVTRVFNHKTDYGKYMIKYDFDKENGEEFPYSLDASEIQYAGKLL